MWLSARARIFITLRRLRSAEGQRVLKIDSVEVVDGIFSPAKIVRDEIGCCRENSTVGKGQISADVAHDVELLGLDLGNQRWRVHYAESSCSFDHGRRERQ